MQRKIRIFTDELGEGASVKDGNFGEFAGKGRGEARTFIDECDLAEDAVGADLLEYSAESYDVDPARPHDKQLSALIVLEKYLLASVEGPEAGSGAGHQVEVEYWISHQKFRSGMPRIKVHVFRLDRPNKKPHAQEITCGSPGGIIKERLA